MPTMPAGNPRSREPTIAARDMSQEGADTESLKHSQDSLDKTVDVTSNVVDPSASEHSELVPGIPASHQSYRLYKRRFVGLVALVILNAVAAMPNPWFGPIANNTSDQLGFSLDKINWFGNVVNLAFLPSSVIVPYVCMRYGIRITCCLGTAILLLAGWIRFAGTATSLSEGGAYGLILLGQIMSGIAQPVFQVLGPLYSETWFDLKGRTTATMLLSVSNPIGSGIAQLISPIVGTTRASILVLAIICTVVAPCAILVGSAPPTPPTFAASQESPSFTSLVRALAGREPADQPSYMSIRERFDFGIITLNFGVLVGIVTSFTILTDQDFGPYGYSSDTSGLMGATLLLAGLVCAAATSPLFDRVFTTHLAITCKILCPILAGTWLSLIWAVRPNNTGALFALMAIVGAASVTLLPVVLELAIEISRNADGSSAILWFAGNLVSVMCVLIEGALRAGPDANPPKNMRRGLIFQGAFACCSVAFIFGLRGRQARREMDERKIEESAQTIGLIETS